MTEEYHFYGSWPSYYSAKARAYMQYKRLPYVHHGATARHYREVILPRTGKGFIPVVVTPQDEALQDTCDIIEELERRHPERPVLPPEPRLRFASLLVELYADECLIYPGLHMRWHQGDENTEWVLREFERAVTPRGEGRPAPVREFARAIRGFADAIGMRDERARRAVRAVFDRLMERLEAHLARHPFLLGPTPSLGDVALMGPIFGHFQRDAFSAALLRTRYPRVCIWTEDMNLANAAPADGGWELPDTALAVLAEIGAGFGAFLRDLSRFFDAWMGALEPGARLERLLRRPLDTQILETPVRLDVVNSYWAYKLQRVRDAYRAVPAAAREEVDALLRDAGCTGIFETPPAWRVAKDAEGWLEVTAGLGEDPAG